MIPEDVYRAGLIPLAKRHGLPLWYAEWMMEQSLGFREDFERSLREVQAVLEGKSSQVPLKIDGDRLIEISGEPFPDWESQCRVCGSDDGLVHCAECSSVFCAHHVGPDPDDQARTLCFRCGGDWLL